MLNDDDVILMTESFRGGSGDALGLQILLFCSLYQFPLPTAFVECKKIMTRASSCIRIVTVFLLVFSLHAFQQPSPHRIRQVSFTPLFHDNYVSVYSCRVPKRNNFSCFFNISSLIMNKTICIVFASRDERLLQSFLGWRTSISSSVCHGR